MVRIRNSAWLAASVLVSITFGAPMASAQFGLKIPKIPKVGKTEPNPPARAPIPKGPMPQVKTIDPSVVPPGWEGDVVFTGINFGKAMKLRIGCGSYNVKTKDFRVESAERAVAHIILSHPSDEEDTVCTIALEVPPGGAMADTAPSAGGPIEVVQVTGPTLTVSNSSALPQAFKACFLGEGDVPPMQIMMKLGQVMQGGSQDECKLLVSADSVKYSNQGKTVMDQPASSVKSIDPILMMGNPTGAFRIVTTSGKIYNFFASGGQHEDNPLSEQIKKKLKK